MFILAHSQVSILAHSVSDNAHMCEYKHSRILVTAMYQWQVLGKTMPKCVWYALFINSCTSCCYFNTSFMHSIFGSCHAQFIYRTTVLRVTTYFIFVCSIFSTTPTFKTNALHFTIIPYTKAFYFTTEVN